MTVETSLGYEPRPQQCALHAAMDRHRWVVAVCHRRMGKTVAAVYHAVFTALSDERPAMRCYIILPTRLQAKGVAWDYLKRAVRDLRGATISESDLSVSLPNGGRVILTGADKPDSLRGIYADLVVLDEVGMHQSNVFSEVLRPALADRKGRALFLGTPNGRNLFYQLAQQAQTTPGWAYLEFRASQTGLIDEEELASARASMTQDEYDQEWECSFAASVRGAIYAREIEQARTDGRITRVPVDPAIPVDTDWDLGYDDATAIVFTQTLRTGETRIVDYYEASGEGLPHYVQVLARKGYTYGTHWAPHDIGVHEYGTGMSRLATAASLGLEFAVTPRLTGSKMGELEEGIHAVRLMLSRAWIDAERCATLLDHLTHYRREFNTRTDVFKAQPVHDRSSHAADAVRGYAARQRLTRAAQTVKKPWNVDDIVAAPSLPQQFGWA